MPTPLSPRVSRALRLLLVLAFPGATVSALAIPSAPAAAAATVACGDLSQPVLQRVDPATGGGLLTVWPAEAAGAVRYGFTTDAGTSFFASGSDGDGLVPVHRLRSGSTGDYVYSADLAEIDRLAAAGYRDQTTSFYVSLAPASCLVGVQRYVRAGQHRLAVGAAGDTLAAAGWRAEGTQFYAASAPYRLPSTVLSTQPIATTQGSTFSFAVVPDTQLEVLRASDTRLADRSRWILRQPKMSFALQTGDLVNWDTPDHVQWRRADRGLAPLQQARLPYTVLVGNHDTLATGPGGSARDPRRTHTLIRATSTLNSTFDAQDFRGVGGEFEVGKVDNLYTLYTAGGRRWMVLSLEFCPRPAVVSWAARVAAAHPRYNVIVSTHSYLTAHGNISTSNGGYGDTSGAYLWKHLVSRYPNVSMVFSGHTGKARKARVDHGMHGNTVYSFLTTFHDERSNPTRLMTVDTKKKTISTRIYAPNTKTTWKAYTQTLKGATFVG
ncbi:metallophosphoesterase [uncultured Friedmanniella sp.]|uniref:metallophosphoesterase n=1 Tax=uncultured Friedmanniella sp. TaxID=335381 RepID=UPI0035CA4F69